MYLCVTLPSLDTVVVVAKGGTPGGIRSLSVTSIIDGL